MYDWDGWIDPNDYRYLNEWSEYDLKKLCKHEWYAIELISSIVYNCKHCDCKKEEYEKK